MTTGIAQKSCTDLFLLWPLRKNDIPEIKTKNLERGNVEGIERNFNT